MPAVVRLYLLSVQICLKIFSLGLVGGGNHLLLKVIIILYGCSVHAFPRAQGLPFLGQRGFLKSCAVHPLLSEPLNAPKASPWCSAPPEVSYCLCHKGSWYQPVHALSLQGLRGALTCRTRPLSHLLTEVLRFVCSGHNEVTRYS